jgi:hypothetical protein
MACASPTPWGLALLCGDYRLPSRCRLEDEAAEAAPAADRFVVATLERCTFFGAQAISRLLAAPSHGQVSGELAITCREERPHPMLVSTPQSRRWMIGCALLLAVAAAVYLFYGKDQPRWPGGGSIIGVIYGGVGTAMMLFALLLGLRRRFRSVRIGKATTWLQGHVWLGIISYPIIVLHAGFHVWGSPMGIMLMVLFTIVFISGIVGLIVQQYLPRELIRDVPGETIYEQIDHVLTQLRFEAQKQVQQLGREESEEGETTGGGTMLATATVASAAAQGTQVKMFYERAVKPFLQTPMPRRTPFASAESTSAEFRRIGGRLSASSGEVLGKLQAIVDERRQLDRQRRLYSTLHAWLLIHVPVSYGLMLLVPVHAIVALRYGFNW